jgi:hypothetical protein
MLRMLLAPAVALSLAMIPVHPAKADQDQRITQAEAENAAQSVAKFCKILITRMEDLIEDQWATQDLQDLAAVWDSLDCHQVFGVDERIRWMLR